MDLLRKILITDTDNVRWSTTDIVCGQRGSSTSDNFI